MADDRITQLEFITNLKGMIPELKDLPDDQILEKVFAARPDLKGQVLTNQELAGQATQKLERRERSFVDPDFWGQHPTAAGVTTGALNTLPAIGAWGGGAAATPETFGGGTILGMGLGAGMGRGARDLITQALGLEDTSTRQKAADIALDTGMTMALPGAIETLRHPINTARGLTGQSLRALPARARPWMVPQVIEDFAKGGGRSRPITGPFGSSLEPSQPNWTPPKTDFKFTAPGTTGTGNKYYAPRPEFGGPGDVREVAPEIRVSKSPDPYSRMFEKQAEIRAAEASRYAPKPPSATTGTSLEPAPVSSEPLKFQVEGKAAEELANKAPTKFRTMRQPNGQFIKVPDYSDEINAILDKVAGLKPIKAKK